MVKINEISEFENNEFLKFNKNGDILCKMCEKRLAKVSSYGCLRKCDECQNIKVTVNTQFDDIARKGIR